VEDSEVLFQNIDQWPVAKASRERKQFIEELNAFTFERLSQAYHNRFEDIITKPVYLQKPRIKFTPCKVDHVDKKAYCNSIGSTLDLINNPKDKENPEADYS